MIEGPRESGSRFSATLGRLVRRHVGLLALAVGAAGAAIRISHFAHRRSLWLDEAMLALNVVQRDLRGLTKPLDMGQSAPIGFLWISKLAVEALGRSELALRLLSLLAGLAVLPLTYFLAQRVAGRGAALLALALVAFSPTLIDQSNEFKPYSSDTMIGLVVVLVALRWLDEPLGAKGVLALALVGISALLLSHSALFVLAAVGTVLAIQRSRTHRWREEAGLAAVFAAWMLAFAALFVLLLRYTDDSYMLHRWWASAMAPERGGAGPFLSWALRSLRNSFNPLVGSTVALLAAALALAGAVAIARRDWRVALVVVLPAFAALGAATLRRYPFSGRLILFLAPLYATLVSAGVLWVYHRLGRARAYAIAATVAVLLIGNVHGQVRAAVHPRGKEEVRHALKYVARRARAGDVLYVANLARYAVEYYQEIVPRDVIVAPGSIKWSRRPGEDRLFLEGVPSDLAMLDGHERVWALFLNHEEYERDNLRMLESRGTIVARQPFQGADVVLFDFSARAPTSARTP